MKYAAILALALLVAACEEQAGDDRTEQGSEAAGEVLGGSISDAMIPLEQLESEAPLLPRRAAAPGRSEDEADAGEAGQSEPESEGAEAAPAAPAPDTAGEQ